LALRKTTMMVTLTALGVVLLAAQPVPKTLEEKYDSGKLKARYTLGSDNVRNGTFEVFYENGKLKESGEYAKGELEGAFWGYHENGQTSLKCRYRNGALDGQWTAFDDKGKTKSTGEYLAGKKNGVFREFDASTIVTEQFFIDDQLIFGRSPDAIAAKLAEIRKIKVETVAPTGGAKEIPAHRGGKQSEDDRIAGARLLMEYRYLCNVPSDISLDAVYNAHDEAAAALLVDVGKLDHFPPNPGWPEAEYTFGKTGCSSSNLHMSSGGSNASSAVRGFMNDSDSSNIDRIGHRRWCINPTMSKTGFGSSGKFVAMWSFDQSRKSVPTYEFVAYPAPGFFPNTHFDATAAWSVSLNLEKYEKPDEKKVHISFKPAQITRSPAAIRLGPEMTSNYFHVDTQGFGIANAIIFRFDKCSTQANSAYQVEITGLQKSGGEAASLKYLVQFYAPGK